MCNALACVVNSKVDNGHYEVSYQLRDELLDWIAG
jgi:hypothetical protein